VVPLSRTDFVHTRLTHSLEVSVVGRSLGRQVGKKLLEKHPHLQNIHGYQINDFGAIVAAAALAHDIGNPPFGHSGEKAIGYFFKEGPGKRFKSLLTNEEYQDLCDFEGNANGFKILTESREGRQGGLRLSYATLGAFMKYPKESLPKKPTSHIADKKYGFFQSEKEIFNEVANELGLLKRHDDHCSYCRHPLAYLVEAADDICYTIIDFEDGINLGLIDEDYALEYLIKLVSETINTKKYNALATTQDRVSYLRALAINTLINESAELFIKNETKILDGTFNHALLDNSKYSAQIADIISLSIAKVYQSNEVINKEIAGFEVLNELLLRFTNLAYNNVNNKLSFYDKLLQNVLPETVSIDAKSLYNNLISICLFISKLSDSNAMLLFKRLKGNTI
ncbi:MAG: dNTP triphosphohydrolase, partial [Winogradskyella sp.]|nr:dNTP triphosphohydrolase [Winogradskyella sp.]